MQGDPRRTWALVAWRYPPGSQARPSPLKGGLLALSQGTEFG
jgi:hypothetical protein